MAHLIFLCACLSQIQNYRILLFLFVCGKLRWRQWVKIVYSYKFDGFIKFVDDFANFGKIQRWRRERKSRGTHLSSEKRRTTETSSRAILWRAIDRSSILLPNFQDNKRPRPMGSNYCGRKALWDLFRTSAYVGCQQIWSPRNGGSGR